MIPAVVVSLVLVTSTVALPLTTQEHPITGIKETPQTQSGIPLTIIPQQTEKTGLQVSKDYTPTGEASQTVQSEHYTGLSTPQRQQVEKTGVQTPSEFATSQEYFGYNQQKTAVSKVENVPVNVEEVQSFHTPNPVLLPVQPLSVVPANPTGQILRPVVVPAEAIADGRVIITPIGSVQQRNFHQDVFFVPENQVPHQEVNQPSTYTAVQTQEVESTQQPYYVQPVEKQTSVKQENQPTSQNYNPIYSNQEPSNREQQVPPKNVVKQTAEPIKNFYQQQQIVQPVVAESAEKQAGYQVATNQVPVQVKPDSQQQAYIVQQPSEKQVPNLQNQVYSGTPIVVENVEKQVPHQQANVYQAQNVVSSYEQQHVYETQQAVEKQTQYQQVTEYIPNQNFQVEQNVAEKTEKQVQYQQSHVQPQQQVQTFQPSVEKQLPQQSIQPTEYVPVQAHPVQGQQQVYSVQPQQIEDQVPYHQGAQQSAENVSEQVFKTSEDESHQQVVSFQPQQVANYAGESAYNFGDKLPLVQHQVHTLSGVPQTQESSVQPSVGTTQE